MHDVSEEDLIALRGLAARTARRAGRLEQSLALERQVLDVARARGDRSAQLRALHDIARCQMALGQLRQAERTLDEAERQLGARPEALQRGKVSALRAGVLSALRDPEAVDVATQCLER